MGKSIKNPSSVTIVGLDIAKNVFSGSWRRCKGRYGAVTVVTSLLVTVTPFVTLQ
ncbi:MAG: hypothetical protein ABR929_12545 [Roseiarcus sp.]|jgi:hypothetical protein